MTFFSPLAHLRIFRLICWPIALLVFASCASYENRIAEPRAEFEHGNFADAIVKLRKLVDRNDNDQLLYLMDLGLVQHEAGRYADAIQTFLRADKLAEIKDYTSLTLEAASIMLSDEVKGYKGEDFEKILIDVYLAIDYTLLHNSEDALVECRIVNHKLDMMISQGQLPYERNRFAKYLSASLFESKGELNDSLVDYRQLREWAPDVPYLGVPLLRLTSEMADEERFDEYRKDYPGVTNYKLGKDQGEVILLLEQGKAPIKKPSPQFRLLPKFYKRYYNSDYVWLRDAAGGGEARTYTFYDIEATAIRDLDHKTGTIVAKKLAGYAVKAAVGYAVAKATGSELAGILTGYALAATDKADLRSWTTLPAHLQIARLTLPAGRHNLVLDMVNHYQGRSPGVKTFEGVEVKPGHIVFLNYRTPD